MSHLGCPMGNRWSQTAGSEDFQPRPRSGLEKEILGQTGQTDLVPHWFLGRPVGDHGLWSGLGSVPHDAP